MTTLFAAATRCLTVMAFLVALFWASPALTNPITWNLSDVTLADGGSASGWFVYNPPGWGLPSVSVTVAAADATLSAALPPGYANPFTFHEQAVNNVYTEQDFAIPPNTPGWTGDFGVVQLLVDVGFVPPDPWYDGRRQYSLFLFLPTAAWLNDPGPIPVTGRYEVSDMRVSGYPPFELWDQYNASVAVVSGELTRVVPLPPSVLLLGSGLLGLAGWRRFRKS